MKPILTTPCRLLGAMAALAATLLLSHCATSPGPMKASNSFSSSSYESGALVRSSDSMMAPPAPELDDVVPRRRHERPGLGTATGSEVWSRIDRTTFRRANAGTPSATAAIYYNDEEGVDAMAAGQRRRTVRGFGEMANGRLGVEIRDGYSDDDLPSFVAGGRRYIEGERGRPYVIAIKNLTENYIEVVCSVDGLDVLDGEAASYRKRGYVLGPKGTGLIRGFRINDQREKRFVFSPVADSVAAVKHDKSRNVGVIGFAVFDEFNPGPTTWREAGKRRGADPFPDARLAE